MAVFEDDRICNKLIILKNSFLLEFTLKGIPHRFFISFYLSMMIDETHNVIFQNDSKIVYKKNAVLIKNFQNETKIFQNDFKMINKDGFLSRVLLCPFSSDFRYFDYQIQQFLLYYMFDPHELNSEIVQYKPFIY